MTCNLSRATLEGLRPYMERLPESVRVMIEENPAGMREILKIHLENTNREFPSKNFIPNIGQERALKCLAQKDEKYGDYPHKVFVLGGNGSGKTASAAAILLAGMCLGPEYVNQKYCDWQYFYDCEKIRKKRKLYVRLVCDAADMKENSGSLWQQIHKWIPTAQFDHNVGYFQAVKIGDVIVDVKTFNQDLVAHAGPDYDAIIFNEPPPENIYRENISRTRGRGRVFLFLTPLDLAAYLYDEVFSPAPDGEVSVGEMSIWDNCADIPGNRGQYSKAEIERMIRDWQKDPDTLDARIYGKFAHLSGVIFKCFGEEHVINPFPIDEKYNLYHMCDPHLVKPPFGMWVAKNALGLCYVVAEYPAGDWSSMRSHGKTIEIFCKDFDLIEGVHGVHDTKFDYIKARSNFRIGDPNMMETDLPNSARSIKDEFGLFGWEYDTQVCDDKALGFQKIRDLLYWDKERPLSSTNMPRLYVFNTCPNTIRALREFGIKRLKDQALGTETQLDKTWDCPIACLRYFSLKEEPWEQGYCGHGDQSGGDMYAEVERGRNPYYARQLANSF